MAESTARIALSKARYFLSQANKAEGDPNTLNDRLPFAANFEAAIVYSRTAIEHLKAEFTSKFREQGYRHWHDQTWRQSGPLFQYFYKRRNFILHQEPEPTHARVNLETRMEIGISVSLLLTVTRADGTTEHHVAPGNSKPTKPPTTASSTQSHHFIFNDDGWQEK